MSRRPPLVPIGAAVGTAIGAAIGFIFHGLASPIGAGLAIGAGVGGMLELWRRRREKGREGGSLV
jgi:hypothetical protein